MNNLLINMKDDEWFDILQTNLTSVYRLSKAMLRSMMKKRFRYYYYYWFCGREYG